MKRGIRFGRKRKLAAHHVLEALARRARGETLASIATSYGVAPSMICRLRSKADGRAEQRK